MDVEKFCPAGVIVWLTFAPPNERQPHNHHARRTKYSNFSTAIQPCSPTGTGGR
jgi:hypothetical protein